MTSETQDAAAAAPLPEPDATAALPFEVAAEQLEAVVRALEEGDIPLEEALLRFEEGVRLSRRCLTLLDSAQGRIERLVVTLNGEATLEPMEEP